jgi:hypothetical protein
MPDDTDGLGYIIIIAMIAFIAYATVHQSGIQPIYYIVLLILISELIYLQILALESKEDLDKLKDNNLMMGEAQKLKILSIIIAVIMIPVIACIFLFIQLVIRYLLDILYVILIVASIIGIWLLYLYINTIPIRLRKKQLEIPKEENVKPKTRRRKRTKKQTTL